MFLTQIQKMDWQTECDMSVPYRAMTVQVGFSHKENDSDETEFCINAWDAKELDELFKIFCQENNFEDISINNLSIVRVAATLEELTELEEQESAKSDMSELHDVSMKNHMKILGKFDKDKRYTIAEKDGELFALYNLNLNGSYEKKYECKQFAPGLYGIGPEIKESLESRILTAKGNKNVCAEKKQVKTEDFSRE